MIRKFGENLNQSLLAVPTVIFILRKLLFTVAFPKMLVEVRD